MVHFYTWVVRPKAKYNEEFSLLPVVNYLKDKLSNPVRLVKDYLDGVGSGCR